MIVHLVVVVSIILAVEGVPPRSVEGITPIPFDKINPRANEFRRLDTDGDDQISFTEFILGDQRYIERQSAAFHKLDTDGNGVVSRGEYDTYYKRIDEERRNNDMERDRFFDGFVGSHHDPIQFTTSSDHDSHYHDIGIPKRHDHYVHSFYSIPYRYFFHVGEKI